MAPYGQFMETSATWFGGQYFAAVLEIASLNPATGCSSSRETKGEKLFHSTDP